MNRGSDNEALLRLAGAVADGGRIDWGGASDGIDPAARENLRRLARLAQLGAASRSGEAAADGSVQWGHLRLHERIGEGGFGEVYRAFDTVLQRNVALKLRRGAIDDRDERAVIDEARRLARVRHPHVLAVHGADVHDGRMGIWTDLIGGETLEQRLRTHGVLPWRELLPMAQAMTEALAAVHAAGLVHGDIKAGNVMLDAGRIVLMDFGAGSERDAGANGLQGSPLSMAPELFAGDAQSAASDVYALGVLWFRLLSARHPIDAESLQALKQLHAQHRAPAWALLPGPLPRRLRRLLERMLGADPALRPGTGDILVQLGLQDAAPRRRRRQWLAATVFGSLALGLVAAGTGYWQARIASGQALKAQAQAQASNDFLADILASPRPTESGRNTLMIEVIEQAEARLDARFSDQPQLADQVRAVLARSFDSIGQGERALRLREAILGPLPSAFADADPANREVAYELALDYVEQRRFDDAQALLSTNPGPAGVAPPEPPRLAIIRACVETALAVWRGDPERAQQLAERNWDLARSVLGSDDAYHALARTQLVQALYDRGRFNEAEPLLTQALDEALAQFGERHAVSLRYRQLLAAVSARLGQLERAQTLAAANLDTALAWLGENDRYTVNAMSTLSNIRGARGDLAQAAELNARALATARVAYGEDHVNTLTLLGNQASRLEDLGRVDQAEALWLDGIERMRRVLGDDDKMTLINRGNLAELWFERGRAADAEAALRDIVARFHRHYGPSAIGSLHFAELLGRILGARGAHGEAIEVLAPALAQARAAAGMASPQAQALLASLAEAQARQGQVDESLAHWRELHALRLAGLGPEHEATRAAAAAIAGLGDQAGPDA